MGLSAVLGCYAIAAGIVILGRFYLAIGVVLIASNTDKLLIFDVIFNRTTVKADITPPAQHGLPPVRRANADRERRCHLAKMPFCAWHHRPLVDVAFVSP